MSANNLHLDKRVPLTWVVGLVLLGLTQIIAGTIFAVNLSNTASANTRAVSSIQLWIAKRPAELPTRATADRLIRIEVNQIAILRALEELKRKLDAR